MNDECVDVSPGGTNAHQEIQRWRRSHENGFLLNFKTRRNATLHTVVCPHLGDPEWESGRKNWGSLGGSRKLLAQRKSVLQQKAKDAEIDLKPCGSCKP